MSIKGIERMTGSQLSQELSMGGKFVVYQYCISVIVLTFERPSQTYFIRSGESAVVR